VQANPNEQWLHANHSTGSLSFWARLLQPYSLPISATEFEQVRLFGRFFRGQADYSKIAGSDSSPLHNWRARPLGANFDQQIRPLHQGYDSA
jgi:hypothetical protein